MPVQVLTEKLILSKSRCDTLDSVKKLDLWGLELFNVSKLRGLVNVQNLTLSMNRIATMKHFARCLHLEELILRKNNLSDLAEVVYLEGLPKLRVLALKDNACCKAGCYRQFVTKMLPSLVKLDGEEITEEQRAAALAFDDEEMKDLMRRANVLRARGLHLQEERTEEDRTEEDSTLDVNESITDVPRAMTPPPPPRSPRTPPPPGALADPALLPSTDARCDNILLAVLTLLKELDVASLDIVRSKCGELISSSSDCGYDELAAEAQAVLVANGGGGTDDAE